ncbi:hypothetical protein BH10PSE18_BH10PSE18_20860 [soil metagenome]
MITTTRPHTVAAPLLLLLLAACGGGSDNSGAGAAGASTTATTSTTSTPAATAPTTSAPTTALTAAPLTISAASPASLNGTLNVTGGLPEVGISGATGSYASAGPNDYCRVAIYEMVDSGDGKKYDLQVIFAKSDRSASFIGLSLNGNAAGYSARAAAPISGVTVDIATRRIGFSNVVLGAGGANAATLNGMLDYPTNSAAADRTTCG